MIENPFGERPPAKKRIITASITAEQRAAFDKLKQATGIETDGALIKKALAEMIDRYNGSSRVDPPDTI